MTKLPVRIEILASTGEYCRFTIPDQPFAIEPFQGDIVKIEFDDWTTHETAVVQYRYHFLKASSVIVGCQIKCDNYHAALELFDKFKDSTEVSDLDTSTQRPPSFYVLYRIVFNLFGKKVFDGDMDSPTVIAELVRSVLILADAKQGCVEDITSYGDEVKRIHDLIIEYKNSYKTPEVPLLWIIKKWAIESSFARDLSEIGEDEVMRIASSIFAELKSVDDDQLPSWV